MKAATRRLDSNTLGESGTVARNLLDSRFYNVIAAFRAVEALIDRQTTGIESEIDFVKKVFELFNIKDVKVVRDEKITQRAREIIEILEKLFRGETYIPKKNGVMVTIDWYIGERSRELKSAWKGHGTYPASEMDGAAAITILKEIGAFVKGELNARERERGRQLELFK